MRRIANYNIETVLHESGHSEVLKAKHPETGGVVILKRLNQLYPTLRELSRFRREFRILQKLKPIEGVINGSELIKDGNGLMIVMEDFGGMSLDRCLSDKPLSIDTFLKLSIDIVSILKKLHEQHIIHKDLTPANIVWNPNNDQIKIIDFGISAELSRENPTRNHPQTLEGTLPYLAPEQTGRMNRAVDHRADFYTLGCSLYHLITGCTPFDAQDPIELVHCHIAKEAPAAHTRHPNIPPAISIILQTMMAKNAEDRYQHADELLTHLRYCLQQHKEHGAITTTTLPTSSKPASFSLPQRMIGREGEHQRLLDTFQLCCEGDLCWAFVNGSPGIGKSFLIQELQQAFTKEHAFFAAGKFDQFNRDIPYYAITHAFQDLIQQLLVLTEDKLKEWRERLLKALGVNGKIICDIAPNLELIIGPQPDVPDLSSNEANNRLQIVCQEFIQAFASDEHPLVLFLDDLQWADQTSLALLTNLALDPGAHHIFYIASYRDNEVSETHPLNELLQKQTESTHPTLHLHLQPFGQEAVEQVIRETLGHTEQNLDSLASVCLAKTGGNPFFLGQFLVALHERHLFTYSEEHLGWSWDEDALHKTEMTDNVLDLMIDQVQKLPEATQTLLKAAACIGNPFDLGILSIIQGTSFSETAQTLHIALEEGFVLPLSDDYKFAEEAIDFNGHTADNTPSLQVKYAFIHDRMQQALYSLLSTEQLQQLHLHIGQALNAQLPPEERELRLFEIVKHLNRGADKLTTQQDRTSLAKDNFQVADKARRSGAFSPAYICLEQGIALLGETGWDEHYELMQKLHAQAIEMAFLCGKRKRMDELCDILLQQATNAYDAIPAYEVRIMAHMADSNAKQALDLSKQVLAQFGVHFPQTPTKLTILKELIRVKWLLRGKTDDALLKLPPTNDPETIATMRIMANMGAPAYTSAPELLPLILFRLIEFSIKKGLSVFSPYAFASYGLILGGALGFLGEGYRFGKLGVKMLDTLQIREQLTRVWMVYNCFVRHWNEPLQNTIEPLFHSYQVGLETGEFEYAAYCLTVGFSYSMDGGAPLYELKEKSDTYIKALERINQMPALIQIRTTSQFIHNMTEVKTNPLVFDGPFFDAEEYKSFLGKDNSTNYFAYVGYQLRIALYFGEWDNALEYVRELEPIVGSTVGSHRLVKFAFKAALTYLHHSRKQTNGRSYLKQAKQHIKKLKKWNGFCPENTSHLLTLALAELARTNKQMYLASEYYDRAIQQAKQAENLPSEAFAHQCAAAFYLEQNREEFARLYITNARYAYKRWGGDGIVHHLEKRYKHLLTHELRLNNTNQSTETSLHATGTKHTSQHATSTTSSSGSNTMDLDTVLKVSQAISGEIVLGELLRSIMHAALENAGAQNGTLILKHNTKWVVEAHIQGASETFHERIPFESYQQNAPFARNIIRYVLRTGTPVILPDATEAEQFNRDEYIKTHQPQSVLCVPLFHKGNSNGVLYLENNLATAAFSPARVELLQVILGQAAISLENATLYEGLEEKVEERTKELQAQYLKLKETQSQLIQSEKMASLGTLVAGVAHEINNPANFTYNGAQNAQGRLHQLRDLIFELIGEEADSEVIGMFNEHFDPLFANLTAIVDGTQRIRSIVTGLRTFSRLDEAEYKQEQLVEGIKSTIALVGANYGDDVVFVCEFEADPELECWPAQLNQVFMNLTVNACHAMTARFRKEATEEKQPGKLIIRTMMKDPDTLSISFQDNGVGMPEAVKQRIFEPFFTTKDVGQGTGLGLSISHGIIEKHHGQFLVESTPNVGTTITILLPITQPEESAPAA